MLVVWAFEGHALIAGGGDDVAPRPQGQALAEHAARGRAGAAFERRTVSTCPTPTWTLSSYSPALSAVVSESSVTSGRSPAMPEMNGYEVARQIRQQHEFRRVRSSSAAAASPT